MRRRSALMTLGAGALALAVPAAFAQPYPVRSIRLFAGFPPGGQSDNIARLIASRLGELLGQPIVIENKSGASGAIAAEMVARAPADGYTLLLAGNSNMVLAPLVMEGLRYDPLRDFVAVGRVARIPLVVAVNSGVPANTFAELLTLLRENPGKFTYASGAIGNQLTVEYLMHTAGLRVVHVPYKGTAPAVLDVVAGRVDFVFGDYGVLSPHARSGTLRLLATTSATRSRMAAQLPPIAEFGFPGFSYYSWSAVVAGSATPADILATLRRALGLVLQTPEVRDGLENMGLEVDDRADTMAGHIKYEIERFRPIVRQIGIAALPQ